MRRASEVGSEKHLDKIWAYLPHTSRQLLEPAAGLWLPGPCSRVSLTVPIHMRRQEEPWWMGWGMFQRRNPLGGGEVGAVCLSLVDPRPFMAKEQLESRADQTWLTCLCDLEVIGRGKGGGQHVHWGGMGTGGLPRCPEPSGCGRLPACRPVLVLITWPCMIFHGVKDCRREGGVRKIGWRRGV